MSTPLSELLSLVAAHGKSQASAFLQGEAVIAGSPDQEIWEHLARHDILWDGLTVEDQDKIRDSYLEAFKQECARRLTGSDPVASPLPISVAQSSSGVDHAFSCLKSIRRYIDGLAEGPHRSAMVKGWNFMVYGVEDPGTVTLQPDWLKSFTEASSPASSVIPTPLVPEVVKEALELAQSFIGEYSGKKSDRASAKIVAALTALRNYSPAPSPSVELLREVKRSLEYALDVFQRSADRGFYPWAALTENGGEGFKPVSDALSKLNAALA